jgi:hypothetical protein
LIHHHDLNPIYSKENLRVQFHIEGELKGTINCYLCLDGHELDERDKNYLFPLFVESMNILVGKQISLDEELGHFMVKLSLPKLNMNSIEINTDLKRMVQKYNLELDSAVFNVLTEYNLSALN